MKTLRTRIHERCLVHRGRAACHFFFFPITSLLHQSVTRGMSGRDRGMSMREGWVSREKGRIGDDRGGGLGCRVRMATETFLIEIKQTFEPNTNQFNP